MRTTKVLFILALLFSDLAAFGQLGTFQRTFGGNQEDFFNDFAPTVDGGFIVVGETRSGISGSAADVIIAKMAGDGSMQWNKTYGGVDAELGYSISQTTDGGYIAAGVAFATAYGAAGIVMKFDSNGDTTWTKVFAPPYSVLYDIIQTADGGYLCGGETRVTGTHEYPCLIKLDNFGNVLWSKSYGAGTNDGLFSSVVEITPGNYAAVGYEELDILLVRVNSTGDTLWEKSYGGNYADRANSIRLTSDGGFIVAGTSQLTSNGMSNEACLLKVNSSGIVQWQKTYSGGPREVNDVFEASNGDYIVVATSGAYDEGIPYLFRTNSSGGFLWAETIRPSGNSSGARSVRELSNGNIGLVGYDRANPNGAPARNGLFQVTNSIGGATCNVTSILLGANTSNLLVARPRYPAIVAAVGYGNLLMYANSIQLVDSLFCSTVNIDKESIWSHYKVFPNPSSDVFRVQFESDFSIPSQIRMINFHGKVIFSGSIDQHSAECVIDCKGLSSGPYLLQVIQEDNPIISKKVVVEGD